MEDQPSLLFKGGTSLSKAHGLIRRFSEDIDISLDRTDLGFGGDADPMATPGSNERARRCDRLLATCRRAIHEELGPALQGSMEESLGTAEGWVLRYADTEGDPTLEFEYPTGLGQGAYDYVVPHVKLELGARSDHFPARDATVTPYAAEAFLDQFARPSCTINTLNAERTFWEKVLILHRENHRAGGDKLPYPEFLFRHYYDVVCIAGDAAIRKAIADTNLRDRVVDHYNVFFRQAWANYSAVKEGKLSIVPDRELASILETDLQRMLVMFFVEEDPNLGDVIDRLRELERALNEL